MRLIDADRLYDQVEARYRQSSGEEHRIERSLLDAICDSPTINAVLVEWLNEMKRWACLDGDNECVCIITYLLDTWKNEQEAQDG